MLTCGVDIYETSFLSPRELTYGEGVYESKCLPIRKSLPVGLWGSVNLWVLVNEVWFAGDVSKCDRVAQF